MSRNSAVFRTSITVVQGQKTREYSAILEDRSLVVLELVPFNDKDLVEDIFDCCIESI